MGYVEIGTAESSPGTTTTGWVDVTELRPELGSPHIIEEQYLDAAITGIHSHRVDRGQVVEPGDSIADVTTPH